MFGIGIASLILMLGLTTLGFVIGEATGAGNGFVGLIIGFVLGIIAMALINFFITNRVKAAQISMMTIGVVEGKLPDNVLKEGFGQLKGRFGKIAAFFFITNAIKGIFRQIGRTFNRVGKAVGGQVGDSVTSIIDSAIQTLIGYLCDCCLGWVMYHKEEKMTKAACEGAVIFFKHGKTLIRNIGRIFGMGALSFLVIGGAFFGISYLIFIAIPGMFEALSQSLLTIFTDGEASDILASSNVLALFAAGIIAIILWSMVHSVLGRPFILVGVLRNFMASGLKERPTEQDFASLDSKSPKFAKLHNSI